MLHLINQAFMSSVATPKTQKGKLFDHLLLFDETGAFLSSNIPDADKLYSNKDAGQSVLSLCISEKEIQSKRLVFE